MAIKKAVRTISQIAAWVPQRSFPRRIIGNSVRIRSSPHYCKPDAIPEMPLVKNREGRNEQDEGKPGDLPAANRDGNEYLWGRG
jgi:hypothetical protein